MSYEFAEKSLLGSMLQENHLILDSGLRAVFFRTHVHQTIYTIMRELAQAGKSVDFITIMTKGEPSNIGGANYLMELKRFASPSRFDEYKEMVMEEWKQQEKGRLLHQALQQNWGIGDIQQSFDELQTLNASTCNASLQDDLVEQYERPFQEPENVTGIQTGLKDLDKILNGFQNSEYIIVAARPSMGKTDTLNHFALQAGWSGHLPIVFSLEMSKKTMIDRLIASTGEYNRLRMRDPHRYFTESQKKTWPATLERLNSAGLYIDDRGGLKVNEIRSAARRIIKKNPDKRPIIFIDYLQIIRPEGKTENQTQAIGQISSALKAMAKEFNCPVVVLSQLSRKVEERMDKHPIMSDLRDSGNIEQDADVIAFLYRKDYYDHESQPTNLMDIQIAKHRNGPTDTLSVIYSKETGKLYNFDNKRQNERGTPI